MTEPPEVTVPPEGGRDDYSGPFDPDFRYEDLSKEALVRLVREFALIAHILDRSGLAAVGMRYGQKVVEEIAIEEWHRRIPDYGLADAAAVRFHVGGVAGVDALPLVWTAT